MSRTPSFGFILFGILIMSIYWYTNYGSQNWKNATAFQSGTLTTQIGGNCSIGQDSITYPGSVNIYGKADSLPFPEFRKYWYRNYGEMTDPFYPNYWNTYWDDSAYFRASS